MRRGLAAGAALALSAQLLVPAGVLGADPPPNDAFSAATSIVVGSLPYTDAAVPIASATFEAGERLPGGPTAPAPTVWYTFTYPAAPFGAVEVNAPGARITAYYPQYGTGLAGLSAGYTRSASTLLIPYFAGRTELVQVAGDGSSSSTTITFTLLPIPANDNIAAAEPVSLPSDSVTDTRTATLELAGNSPLPWETMPLGCAPRWAHSVWYRFTATSRGVAVVDPTASDFADVTLTARAFTGSSFSDMSTVGCIGSRMPLRFAVDPGVTYYVRATDATGIGGGGSLRLHWALDLPPSVTVPGSMTVAAAGPAGAVVTYGATADDPEDGPLATACNWPSGAMFPIAQVLVTCSATDRAGNRSSASFWVTVVDLTPPRLGLPGDLTVPATGPAGASVAYVATADDEISPPASVQCSPLSGAVFPIGTTTVHCAAADALGNPAWGEFTVTVLDLGPEIVVPGDVTIEADDPSGTMVRYLATATDAVDGPVQIACSPASGSVFPIGTTRVACEAHDSAGNPASAAFSVNVVDTTPPVVAWDSHPAVYTVADAIDIGCTATDAVGVVSTTCEAISGFGWSLGIGTHSRSATATDAAGNVGSASTSFAVVVTYASLKELTARWVSKPGVLRDLLALLDSAAAAEARGQLTAEAGKLADYRALLAAQAGKSIPAARAELLGTLSRGL